MKVLLLGGGGREHALAWKLRQSPLLRSLYCAPGNGGTASLATHVTLDIEKPADVLRFCQDTGIDIVVIGPEAPLVAGVADVLKAAGIFCVGPNRKAAELEGSKWVAKQFMARRGIPTAAYGVYTATQFGDALDFLRTQSPPFVIKADGLAAGKGVVIAPTLEEAEGVLHRFLQQGVLGPAGKTVIIEQYLQGVEVSCFVYASIQDGKVAYKRLPDAKDYKRIGEGDTGPNTGGMGAVSPVPFVDAALAKTIDQSVILPTLNGLAAEGLDYEGFLFFGLMVVGGHPYVLEYNVRLGDPETQAILPLLNYDLLALFHAAQQERLADFHAPIKQLHSAVVVLASRGYPGAYAKGKTVTWLDGLAHATAFHAGTAHKDGILFTNGGRVVALSAQALTQLEAVQAALAAAETVQFEGKTYRRDIGADLA